MAERISEIVRTTNETNISLTLNIDGKGKHYIDIPVGFLKHMLELFSKHGLFDLTISGDGDIEIDYHHIVEDIAICLGSAFKKALGKMEQMKRYGFFILPMDETLAQTAVDFCNRPNLQYNVKLPGTKTGDFDTELIQEFFEKFVVFAGISLHIKLENCKNVHHGIEAIFKCVAKTLDIATQIDERISGINSTKGGIIV